MWDKLTEGNNSTKSRIISDHHELYRFLKTPGIEVTNLMFASDDVVWASSCFIAQEEISSLRCTNEVILVYVTEGVRLHSYAYLDILRECALYCDTESVLFVEQSEELVLVSTGTISGS